MIVCDFCSMEYECLEDYCECCFKKTCLTCSETRLKSVGGLLDLCNQCFDAGCLQKSKTVVCPNEANTKYRLNLIHLRMHEDNAKYRLNLGKN